MIFNFFLFQFSLQKKFKKLVLITFLIALPFLAFAQDNGDNVLCFGSIPERLVPCGGPNQSDCNVCHLLELIQNIIQLIFMCILPWIVIVMIFYGGFLWLFSGGKEENIRKGQKLIINAIIGFAIAICAYIIVNTLFWIIGQLGGTEYQGTWSNIEC
ncbi:MAG TPA: pilin [Candidatus Paceibacterota bacterium]|nr:pilin [Candidatus Paceibacterota bacterium]HPC30735.1 pilin [Candidatus Pacearchaeota archaeon]HPQ23040.1 pilin [Candidatus Paceibacterota bacterium]